MAQELDKLESIEEAVWQCAGGSDPRLRHLLSQSLKELREHRQRKATSFLEHLFAKQGIILTSIAGVIGLLLQQSAIASELAQQESAAKMRIRSELIFSYVEHKDVNQRITVLETAKAIPSVMAPCAQSSETPWYSVMDFSARHRARDCKSREEADRWVAEQRENLMVEVEKRDSATPLSEEVAEELASDAPAEFTGDSAGAGPDSAAVDTKVAMARLDALNDGGASIEIAAQNDEAMLSPRNLARKLWNQGLKASSENQEEEARGLYERAQQADPEYWPPYNSLGRLAVGNGDYETAIKQYNRSLEKLPNYAPALYNLALAYAKMHDKYRAVEAWEKAIQESPSYRLRKEVRRHLLRLLPLEDRDLPDA